MNKLIRTHLLTILSLIAGDIALALDFWLRSTKDSRGLLTGGHISMWLLPVVLVASLAFLGLLSRKYPAAARFPKSFVAGICAILSAAGLLWTDIGEYQSGAGFLAIISLVLGILAAMSLFWLGICRFRGHAGHSAPQLLMNVYFILHLVFQYRNWSSEPQILLYCYPLLASVCLMLASYHRAALTFAGKGLRSYAFWKYSALVLCICSIGENWLFYGCMALWLASDWFVPHIEKENTDEVAQ